MGENNESILGYMLLKNIDKEIPVDFSLIDPPEKNSPSTTRMLAVSKLDDYIHKKYKKTTGSRHTKEIMLELN